MTTLREEITDAIAEGFDSAGTYEVKLVEITDSASYIWLKDVVRPVVVYENPPDVDVPPELSRGVASGILLDVQAILATRNGA